MARIMDLPDSDDGEDQPKRLTPLSAVKMKKREAIEKWWMEEANVERACRTLPCTLIFWVVFVGAQLTHRHVEQGFTMNRALDRLLEAKHSPLEDDDDNSVSEPDDNATVAECERRLEAILEESYQQHQDPSALTMLDLESAVEEVRQEDRQMQDRRLLARRPRITGSAGTSGIALDDVHHLQSPNSVLDWVDETPVRILWLPRNWNQSSGSYVSHFNRVIGGIRLMQARVVGGDCPGSDELIDFYGRACYEDGSQADNIRASRPGFSPVSSDGISDGRYVYWLDIAQTLEETLARTEYLRDSFWLDAATANVEVQMAMYNGETSFFIFARTIFTLDRTGYLSKKVLVTSVPSDVYAWLASLMMDFLLLICVLVLFIGQLISIWQRHKRGDSLREAVCRFQVLLNFSVVFIGGGLGSYFGYINLETKDAVDQLLAVPEAPGPSEAITPDSESAAWSVRHSNLNTVYDRIQRLGWFQEAAEVAVFWYVLLLVVKFFEAFSGIPRLAVITRTLQLASWDLVHFLLVFGIIFTSFSVGAFFLFGQKIKEWSSPGLALNTSFRALMGDFDFVSMYNVAPVSATVWFWSYMMLIFLVMLNMLLAIIMDTYCEVKEQSKSNADILTAAKDVVAAFRLRRTGVETDKVVDSLTAAGQEVNQEMLEKAGVPKGIAQHIERRISKTNADVEKVLKTRQNSMVSESMRRKDTYASTTSRTSRKQEHAAEFGEVTDVSPVTHMSPTTTRDHVHTVESSRNSTKDGSIKSTPETRVPPDTDIVGLPGSTLSSFRPATAPSAAQLQDLNQRLVLIENALAKFFNSDRKVYIIPEQLSGRTIDVTVGDVPGATRR